MEENFVIKREIKMDGKVRFLFHQFLKPSKGRHAENVYVESVTEDRDKAMVFFHKKEADAMAVYLLTSLDSSEGEKATVVPA